MAICGNCGAESVRVRSRWVEGQQLPDECPRCAPQEFERFRSVRDGQIVMAHEYDHTKYRTINGIPQITDEGLADLEAAATKESQDDVAAYNRAVERKRSERRTAPLSSQEIKRTLEHIGNIIESTKSA